MYPLAVENGIQADVYWSLLFVEIMTQIEANRKIHEVATKEKAMFDYKQAQLIMYAVNDPKKFPAMDKIYPVFNEETESKAEMLSEPEKQIQEMNKDQAIFMQNAEMVKRHQLKLENEGGDS